MTGKTGSQCAFPRLRQARRACLLIRSLTRLHHCPRTPPSTASAATHRTVDSRYFSCWASRPTKLKQYLETSILVCAVPCPTLHNTSYLARSFLAPSTRCSSQVRDQAETSCPRFGFYQCSGGGTNRQTVLDSHGRVSFATPKRMGPPPTASLCVPPPGQTDTGMASPLEPSVDLHTSAHQESCPPEPSRSLAISMGAQPALPDNGGVLHRCGTENVRPPAGLETISHLSPTFQRDTLERACFCQSCLSSPL